MSIKLLPAAVNSLHSSQASNVSPSETSTALVPLSQRAITTRAGQISLVPSADAFAWSPSTRSGGANRINGTPVEDSQSDETTASAWEYVSAWAGIHPVHRTAIAHYLSYAASPASWTGWLINLYA